MDAPSRVQLLAAVAALAASPAAGQIPILEGDPALQLSGYVRSLTGVHDRGYDLPAGLEQAGEGEETGFHGQVLRLKWLLEGGGWRLEVHDRFQASVGARGDQRVLGFGVSAVPSRLDLRSDLVTGESVDVWHDVDRLSLTIYTGAVDLTLGRQAITWGISSIFPMADLWAQFSPFELDTEEKPGIDAARALFYPAEGLEMDLVLADRGSARDLSFGARATYGFADADVWAGAGKLWREIMAMGGVTYLLDEIRLRAEGLLPYDMDAAQLLDPRATAGIDWIRGTLSLTGEYHFNGLGAAAPGGYLDRLASPPLARGETYYVGRHYLGAVASWSPDEENRATLALNALSNLGDGSFALTPLAGYDLGQATRISVGALVSFGETPVFVPAPALTSEFGTYGDLFFTRLSIYF